ncbi:MAG: membrane protein insertion efficiency factor YidD [Luteitalea sp.]|nr:membrane protein insertion efficiency factor YidD [Luteitalea sp.]
MKSNSDRPSTAVSVALVLLRGYKLLLSPLFPGACRFVPSCSDYARDAYRQHGVWRGTWLALKRLSRCQPLCRGGYDPVPH